MTARALWLSAVISVALLAAPARAQDAPTPPDLPPGDDTITALAEGARAPHAGMLLDTDTAIRWTNRARWWPEWVTLHLAEDADVLTARTASHALELTLVQESYTREIEGLRVDLREAVLRYEAELARWRQPPFYETWGFAFGMGVVVTGVVVALIGALALGL